MRAGKSWIAPKKQSAGYCVPSRDESPGPARSVVDRSHAVSLVVPRRDVRRCRQPLRQPRRSAGDVVPGLEATHTCSSVGETHTRGRFVALSTRINTASGNVRC